MKTSLSISPADQQRLQSILDHLVPSPWPTPDQAAAIGNLLSRARKSRPSDDSGDPIGFYNRVSLVSPTDPHDSFDFRIVMPAESNPDEDRLSVLLPVALAVLGRRAGDSVSWECPRGTREMQVNRVQKSEELTV